MVERSNLALGEVVRVVRKVISPAEIDLAGHYVLLEHIAQKTGEVSPARPDEYEIKSAKSAFEAGDVLFGKLRPQLRKCCVAESFGACSTDVAVLRPVSEGSGYYIAAMLRSEAFISRVERLIAGANLPRVNVKDLLSLELPWPTNESDLVRLEMLAKEAIGLRGNVSNLSRLIGELELSITS